MKTPQRPIRTSDRRCTRGFTLVELLAGLAVMAVALGTVLPDFSRLMQRQRLEGAAAQLETELQMARSEAILRGKSVRFSFRADATGTCYAIHTGSAQACRCDTAGQAPQCAAGTELIRSVSQPAGDALQVRSNSASFLFDGSKGTVTPTATLTLSNERGDTLQLIVSLMGRVRDCSPSGLRGHRPC